MVPVHRPCCSWYCSCSLLVSRADIRLAGRVAKRVVEAISATSFTRTRTISCSMLLASVVVGSLASGAAVWPRGSTWNNDSPTATARSLSQLFAQLLAAAHATWTRRERRDFVCYPRQALLAFLSCPGARVTIVLRTRASSSCAAVSALNSRKQLPRPTSTTLSSAIHLHTTTQHVVSVRAAEQQQHAKQAIIRRCQ